MSRARSSGFTSMELIMADQKITEREEELLYFLGECFHFNASTVDEIRNFVFHYWSFVCLFASTRKHEVDFDSRLALDIINW